LFLENIGKWIKPEDTDVVKVSYTTKRAWHKELLEEYRQGKVDRLIMNLPQEVLNTKWDCIFVDSPVGTTDKKPGRMQSIFMASKLANSSTDIFVHDCDRQVEDIYTKEMFSSIEKELTKLRHCKK
jgi:TFIIF-interacting CTD phosphatase-like protein